jgi:UDP-3-O-acyl-N-acetylglucosamine deacetylase
MINHRQFSISDIPNSSIAVFLILSETACKISPEIELVFRFDIVTHVQSSVCVTDDYLFWISTVHHLFSFIHAFNVNQ